MFSKIPIYFFLIFIISQNFAYGDREGASSPTNKYQAVIRTNKDSKKVFSMFYKNKWHDLYCLEYSRVAEIFWSPEDQYYYVIDHYDQGKNEIKIYQISETKSPIYEKDKLISFKKELRIDLIYLTPPGPSISLDLIQWKIKKWDTQKKLITISCHTRISEETTINKGEYIIPLEAP